MSVYRLPGGKFRVQIRRKNSQLDQVFDTEKEAIQAEARALEKPSSQAARLTINELWSKYSGSSRFSGKAAQTQATERSRIKPVLRELGRFSITELADNAHLIYEFMDARGKATSPKTGKKLSPTSIRLEIAALSSVVAFAKERGYVRENFVASISRPVTKRRKRRVTNKEQGVLFVYVSNSDFRVAQIARFLLLVRHLGCRPGELSSLERSSLQFLSSQLTFKSTKNGQDRCIHITEEALKLLNAQLQEVDESCPYVFASWSKKQKRWQPYNYAYGVKLLRKLKIVSVELCAHAGRREFISRAIEASVPFGTIKKQTGHKSTQALELYDEGLSTAPEIRSVFDSLAKKVKDENLLGVLEAMNATPEEISRLLKLPAPPKDGLTEVQGWNGTVKFKSGT